MYPGTIHPLWVFLLFSCWIQSTKSCWELSTVLAFLRDALPIKIGIHYMVLTTGLGRANGHRLHVYQSIWFFSLPSRGIEPGSITWKSEMTLHHGGCKYSVNLNVYHVKILPLNHHFKIDRNLICLLFMFLCHLTFCHGAENHPRYQGCIYFWTTILWSRPFYRYMKPIVHLDCPMCWKAPMGLYLFLNYLVINRPVTPTWNLFLFILLNEKCWNAPMGIYFWTCTNRPVTPTWNLFLFILPNEKCW